MTVACRDVHIIHPAGVAAQPALLMRRRGPGRVSVWHREAEVPGAALQDPQYCHGDAGAIGEFAL